MCSLECCRSLPWWTRWVALLYRSYCAVHTSMYTVWRLTAELGLMIQTQQDKCPILFLKDFFHLRAYSEVAVTRIKLNSPPVDMWWWVVGKMSTWSGWVFVCWSFRCSSLRIIWLPAWLQLWGILFAGYGRAVIYDYLNYIVHFKKNYVYTRLIAIWLYGSLNAMNACCFLICWFPVLWCGHVYREFSYTWSTSWHTPHPRNAVAPLGLKLLKRLSSSLSPKLSMLASNLNGTADSFHSDSKSPFGMRRIADLKSPISVPPDHPNLANGSRT